MATLVLGAVGAALGSVFGGLGAALGRAAGALAGHALDGALFGSSRRREGPRLADLQVQSSTEGSVIPRLYGRARLAGQIIWATDFEEAVRTERQGGKGGSSVTTTEYSYFANFAVALCEGPIAHIGRIWADGKPLDASNLIFRVYRGTEDQEPDSLILARQGTAPAYRGTAYVVFERMPVGDFGNRIPQLTFEALRPVAGIEDHVRAVCIIPGSTEFGYDTQAVVRVLGEGSVAPENVNAARDRTDWTCSLDELQALCPRLEWATLIVAWFGDDLRAAHCTIRPKVDEPDKQTTGASWAVAGLTRANAATVSAIEGRAAYGGSPSDASVRRAIADLKARGLKVALAPFILMDVPAGNGLPDPYGGAEQGAYPWRGLITCDPAPGRPGTADKTAAGADQVAAFLGDGSDWRYRRFVLHYAQLAAEAGADAFLIGSEQRGLTALRSGAAIFPFVDGLKALAAEARALLGPQVAITYGADWTEYFGHQPQDGSGDVYFHLDPLWADPAIDAVGIDVYHPLTDWRDGPDHADAESGRSPYDRAHLMRNVRGGEGYDWFYPGPAERAAQIRLPVADGAHGKPWTFRYKDLFGWWANLHFNRPGGVELSTPTGWLPMAKPIWLTELGCPAVDKGANQPNVFYDPKSAQSALPHFSSGARDDLAQRSYIDAFQRAFDPDHPGYAGGNPWSPVYGGPMVDPAHLHLWAWDARPYPHFPARTDLWSDGENWLRGHWLNGRLGAVTLEGLIAAVLGEHGFARYRVEDAHGLLAGFWVNQILSARDTLEPLLRVFGIDAADAGDAVLFRGRSRPPDLQVAENVLVELADEALLARTRAQETELPSEVVLRAAEPDRDFRVAAAASRRVAGRSRRTLALDLTAAIPGTEAERLCEGMLHDLWSGRERLRFACPPSLAAIEPGDILRLEGDWGAESLLVERVADGGRRDIEARTVEARPAAQRARPSRPAPLARLRVFGPPAVKVLELPPPPDGDQAHAPRLAVFAEPWPGAVAIHRAADGGGFVFLKTLSLRATIGRLLAPLGPGPLGVFDEGNAVEVELAAGAIASLPDADVLAGGNLAAVRSGDGWEALQFARAALVGERRYRLSRLLRGQGGTERAMRAGAAEGADFVLLDQAATPLPLRPDAVGRPLRYRFGPARDPHGAPSHVELTIAAEGRGLLPFAPVHARLGREENGDLRLSWIRRTRFGGDAWEAHEVPLNEEAERYRIAVLDGAATIRQAETGRPSWTYPAAEQAADFGAPVASLEVEIRQLSATAGPGEALRTMLHA